MRSFFATLRQLVLPAGAGSGTPRIVIGPDVPPELQAYYNIGLARMTSCIVWYYGNATNTYHYYGVVDLGGGVPPGNVVRGDVLAGLVIPADTYVGADWTVWRTIDMSGAGVGINVDGSVNIGTPLTQKTSVSGSDTTASAVYVQPGVLPCGVAFVAPLSGQVEVYWMSQMANDTINARNRCSPSLRDGNVVGSGTVVTGSNDLRCTLFDCYAANAATRQGGNHFYAGLTPGGNYNISLEYRTTAGTLTMSNQSVLVAPSL